MRSQNINFITCKYVSFNNQQKQCHFIEENKVVQNEDKQNMGQMNTGTYTGTMSYLTTIPPTFNIDTV